MSETNGETNGVFGTQLDRRQFIKTSALLGSGALAAAQAPWLLDFINGTPRRDIVPDAEYVLANPENVIYTACLGCQIRCNVKVKNHNGVVVKIDGSPYSAKQLLPNLPYDTSPFDAATVDGKICPKGLSGVQVQYDPYRLRKVLKRVGPRGGGEWQTIDFNQAVDEIVNGGDLFGEGAVQGLKDIYALRDPDAAKKMADDIKKISAEHDVGKRKTLVDKFKTDYAAQIDTLIDPDHPDLGPKNNQLVFQPGRINRGRVHFAKRFLNDAFGSVNIFPHTSICELSIFVSTSETTRDYTSGKSKNHFKADFLNAEFVLFWGTGFADANFGLTPMTELVTKSLVERGLKIAVIDPRLSKSAAKAWRWVPIKPSTDAALALGMIRWIIENERYDKQYLENPNVEAAKADGETTATDATYLVRTDKMVLLRAEDLGMEVPPPEADKPKPQFFVVMTDQGPARHDLASAGQLEVDTKINDIPVKSVFTLLKERALEKSLDEVAEITGVSVADIEELADEFTSHGKKAATEIYRGVAQHTNGFYTVQAINVLNMLIGNMDWKGGLADGGGSWNDLGQKGQPYVFGDLHPKKTKAFGVTMTREGWKYEDSTLFDRDGGYPAKRPWYPFAFEMYQDVIPAATAGYPYPARVLWLHMGTPAYSVPAGSTQIAMVRDTKLIPLFIATDMVVGETSMYADYLFPDLSYLERWASPGDVPQPPARSNPFRQPAVAPVPETVTVFGEELPISMEAIMLAIAERLELPGFGENGFGDGIPLKRPEDYYLKIAANLAFGDKEDGSEKLPDADDSEVQLFLAARSHLPPSVFDEAKWRAAVGEESWRGTVYVLNRGGRFEHLSAVYDGDHMKHKFGGTFHIFNERVAKQKDSVTGTNYDGLARYDPPLFANGNEVGDQDFEFQLITHKEAFGANGRTSQLYWAQDSIQPENFVRLNARDADRLGLDDDDRVRIVSADLPEGDFEVADGRRFGVEGKVKRVQGLRPGVVVVSHHYGHWAYGSDTIVIDGEEVKGDERRGKGLNPNPAMRLDEHTGTVCLTDPIGGSAVFYDTRVRLVKA
jgi:anaerobic selenocysteine-containing dehydrogenase